MTRGIVACFAGKIGSGKTSVTKALAQCLNWRRVGFGDYVRGELARRGGDAEARKELQELGQRLAESDQVSLCRAVLSLGHFKPGDDLLVDGIRHAAVYRVLTDIVKPSRTYLFYLRATDDVRGSRAAERGEVTSMSAQSHLAEAELTTTIPSMADAVVDASGSFSDVVCHCVDVLSTCGVDSRLIASCKKYALSTSDSRFS